MPCRSARPSRCRSWPATSPAGVGTATPGSSPRSTGRPPARPGTDGSPPPPPGYGYVADDTPELAIAVEPAFRRAGVGAALLDALIASAVTAGVPALSLSVSAGNPSRRLYERAGFEDVAVDEGGSHTMLLRLDPA